MGSVKQQLPILFVRGVSADNAVAAEDPEVAFLRYDGLCLRCFRYVVRFVEVIVKGFGQGSDEAFHLVLCVACQLHGDLPGVYICENVSQQLIVCLCQLCDPVVGHQISVFLRFVGVVLVVYGCLLHTFQKGSREASVSFYDKAGAFADCDRLSPPGLPDNAAE